MSYFRQKFNNAVALHKSELRGFLSDIEENPPLLLDTYTDRIEKEVWGETDCLACSNCCRNMTPVFTVPDIKRIATHLRMSVLAFKKRWLYKNKNGEWMNRSQPCQFLNLHTNMCSVYAVRPADCASFPHLAKKRLVDYIHVHKQNIAYCPATFKMVEKLMQVVKEVEEGGRL